MSIYMYQLRDLIRRSCRWILLLVKQKLQLWIHSPSPHKVIYQVLLAPVVFHFLDSFSGAFRYCSIVAHSVSFLLPPLLRSVQRRRNRLEYGARCLREIHLAIRVFQEERDAGLAARHAALQHNKICQLSFCDVARF